MRKSFVALALLVGAMVFLTNQVLAQQDEGLKLRAPKVVKELTRASRLGTAADTDTFWIGHVAGQGGKLPYHVGRGPYRPGLNRNGMWDFEWTVADSSHGYYDTINHLWVAGQTDSMQGWVPVAQTNNRTSGTIADNLRPWMALDYGNRLCATPKQGHTIGIISAWHADGGVLVPDAAHAAATPLWTPLGGAMSAWCGIRAGDDNAYTDAVTLNPINGEALMMQYWDGLHPTQKNFPGYANQWDQMLYRDVVVADGGNLTVSFKYQTYMSTGLDNTSNRCTGWFQYDPLYVGSPNFISATGAGKTQPIDSFMVYVGVPTDSAGVYLSNSTIAPIFDLQRRWFSEVLKIDAPFQEILTTFGQDSVYKSTAKSISLTTGDIQPMLDALPGSGGIIRTVFRIKTNTFFADETGSGGFQDWGYGAAFIDGVDINGTGVTPHVQSGFESTSDINNQIEGPEAGFPGTGRGYAYRYWHATGKPPANWFHTHPLGGGDIGGGNVYQPLAYDDLCGPPDSPLRHCNIYNVVVSSGNHDDNEAAGGPLGTPWKEYRSGMMGPTINLVVPPVGENSCGLDAYHVNTTSDWHLYYDMYAGIFNAPYSGNVWGWGLFNYPNSQANGSVVWGDVCIPTYVLFNPDPVCVQDYELMKADGLIETTNPSGIPDSIRIMMRREQRCISWGITTGCSPTGGHYYDNIALGFPPNAGLAPNKISVDIWQWIHDAFPANETPGLPGTAAFDTCAAHIMTGINTAQTVGSTLRFNIPGDSIFVVAAYSWDANYRMDLVFRILPGPGNYVIPGNVASGLRQRPDQAAAVVRGDGSFWGQYLAAPGEFSKGTFSGTTWNPDVWCSARCDSLEGNLFPVNKANPWGLQLDRWQSTYHEADGKYGTLGILKNKCFLIDTLGVLTSTNITCSSVPDWLLNPDLAARAGYDGQQQTREFTKILPDGLLTPGSHVEYFFRQSDIPDPGWFVMCPDTNVIYPQPNESNFDAHRWQQFGILPDRWKDVAYGGVGSACMLALDYNDRRGDERVFISLGDSIGMSAATKYGAHNGWYCTGAYTAWDGTHDYTGEYVAGLGQYDAVGGMGAGKITIWKHGGQPGTTFDFYQVKAAESSATGAGGIGARLANRADMGLAAGKFGRQAPTPEMLRTYYKLIYLMSGDLNTSVLGPTVDRGSDDVGILEDFLTYSAGYLHPRGLWVMGDGFAQSETEAGGAHATFLTDYLACSLRDPSYFGLSGSSVLFPDLLATGVISGQNHIFTAQNSCVWTNDVLSVNPAVPGAMVADYYQNLGPNGPYVSSVYAPSSSDHPYVTLVDGYNLMHLKARYGNTSIGRQVYFMDVLVNVFGSVCPFVPTPTIDVPENTVRNVDFLDNVWGNPMRAGGAAIVSFSLAKADRVEIKVYDVTGRLVRTLADRTFEAGPQQVTWDGTSDQGQRVARGVYFTQVKFAGSRFVDAKKVTVLR
jgi:hypothetical protein